MRKLRPTPDYYEQLALDLELPAEDLGLEGFVSPEEARRRSLAARGALELTGQAEAPGWFEQYNTLLTAGWPWRVACYIAWAASPKKDRWPKTQDGLATEILGLTSDRQISTWRKRNPGIDDMITVLQALPLMEYRADAFLALGMSAANPDHRHKPDRQLLFEMTGDYTPRLKVDDARRETEDLGELSEAELEEMARLLRKGPSPSLSPALSPSPSPSPEQAPGRGTGPHLGPLPEGEGGKEGALNE